MVRQSRALRLVGHLTTQAEVLMVYLVHMRGGQRNSGRLARLWLRARHVLFASRAGGFTVIEVVIVLAITSLLFVSAAVLIAGRQNRTAFEQAVRNIQSQIQAVIDEVVVGHYPNTGNLRCVAGGSGPAITAGTSGQGTNGDCIFMGRVIQFGVADTDPEQFKTYTIAGLRLSASGKEVKMRTEAMPILVAPSLSQPTIPDGTITAILEHGLTTGFIEAGNPAVQVGGISVWQSLALYGGTEGTVSSGIQDMHIGAVTGTTLGMTQEQFVAAANDSLATLPLDDPGGVRLCFVSGGTNQSGLITVGGNQRRLEVALDIKSNRTCS